MAIKKYKSKGKRQKLYRSEHGRAYEISGKGHPTVHHSKRPSKYEAKREEGYVDREYNINDPKYRKMGEPGPEGERKIKYNKGKAIKKPRKNQRTYHHNTYTEGS